MNSIKLRFIQKFVIVFMLMVGVITTTTVNAFAYNVTVVAEPDADLSFPNSGKIPLENGTATLNWDASKALDVPTGSASNGINGWFVHIGAKEGYMPAGGPTSIVGPNMEPNSNVSIAMVNGSNNLPNGSSFNSGSVQELSKPFYEEYPDSVSAKSSAVDVTYIEPDSNNKYKVSFTLDSSLTSEGYKIVTSEMSEILNSSEISADNNFKFPYITKDNTTKEDTTWKLEVKYLVAENPEQFATYSKSYKSGAVFNPAKNTIPSPDHNNPNAVLAFKSGASSTASGNEPSDPGSGSSSEDVTDSFNETLWLGGWSRVAHTNHNVTDDVTDESQEHPKLYTVPPTDEKFYPNLSTKFQPKDIYDTLTGIGVPTEQALTDTGIASLVIEYSPDANTKLSSIKSGINTQNGLQTYMKHSGVTSERELDEELAKDLDGNNNTGLTEHARSMHARLAYIDNAVFKDGDAHKTEMDSVSKWYEGGAFDNIDLAPSYMNDEPIMLTYTGALATDSLSYSKYVDLLYLTILEWGTLAGEWRQGMQNEVSAAEKEALLSMQDCVVAYGEAYPQIEAAWEYKGINGDEKSLHDLCDGVDPNTISENDLDDTAYDVESQPLKNFFTSYTLGSNNTIISDPWHWFFDEITATPAALLSSYIKTGISYSAAYIPMQTNVYTPDTINDMDQTFREDFHYKYGFMRKAVFIDKSATAVTDYYNTSGTQTGSMQVCTLKDLLNAKNDVMLYIDDNFYNADQLPDLYVKTLRDHKNDIDQCNEAFDQYYYNVGNVDETTDTTTAQEVTTSENTAGSGGASATNALTLFETLYGTSLGAISSTTTLEKVAEELKVMRDSLYDPDDVVLKHNSNTTYSADLRKRISNEASLDGYDGNYLAEAGPKLADNNLDMYVLPSYELRNILEATTERREIGPEHGNVDYIYKSYNEYSPLLSYAFVSGIYRNGPDFSLLFDGSNYSPIFMASEKLPELAATDSMVSATLQNTIYNYALLKNLESMSQITYTYSLDMDSPLYTDIYGNILTASGVVVIPAASNATLFAANWAEKQPGIGLYSCYGNDYRIPTNIPAGQLMTCFTADDTGKWYIPISRTTGNLDYANLDSYSDESKRDAVTYFAEYLSSDSNINWWAYIGIIAETMRGAPINYIDINKEGLVSQNLNAEGLVLAAKLESLVDNLKNAGQENSLFVIPDFTRMEHLDYVMAFIVKLLCVLTVGVVIVTVYRDGVAGVLGFRTFMKTVSAVFLTFLSIGMIPAIFQFTYYGANKLLLQGEAEKIALYSTEKYQSGVEVGVTKTTVPTNDNDLMVQLDWVNIPWYEYAHEMIVGNSIKNVETVRENSFKASLVAGEPDVTLYNDGVYMSVTDIMNSATIDYSFGQDMFRGMDTTISENAISGNSATTTVTTVSSGSMSTYMSPEKSLYLYNNSERQTLSYYSPYYVFLYALVNNVNQFNAHYDTYRYTTKYMSGSRLKTVGVCAPYFSSSYFMEECTDIFHLYNVFDMIPETAEYEYDLFSSSDIEQMTKSYWYNNQLDEFNTNKRIDMMNTYARDFIARNRELLNKVSDETFIKIMALSCAMKYNQIYGISSANCYEMYNLDANDLLRLSVCKSDDAILASPLSYARYLYTYGGIVALYAGAALTMVMWIGAFIKPLCTVLVFISVFLSIFVFKVVLRKPGGMLGYILTCVFLCIANIVHALLLKFSTLLPSMHMPTAACLILITLGQVFYLLLLANITGIAVRDWQDLGSAQYQADAKYVKSVMRGDTAQVLNGKVARHKDNWDYYDDLVNQQRDRSS